MNLVVRKRVFEICMVSVIGGVCYLFKILSKSPIADPLLTALLVGIIIGSTFIKKKSEEEKILSISPEFFIMPGIIFYAFGNINFVKIADYDIGFSIWLVLIMVVYVSVVMLMGKLLKQKKEITYLTATGSVICGASAIAITTPVVKGDSDDVSISLLAVAFVGVLGLFIIFPLLGTMFKMNNQEYGIFSGAILQFTGFVKAAMADIPGLNEVIPTSDAAKLAMSIKATRYFGLLFLLPLFGYLSKHGRKMSMIVIAFIVAGIVGSVICKLYPDLYSNTLLPVAKPVYGVLWSMAMTSIGLRTNAQKLITDRGMKALIMAFTGFVAAILMFFCGYVLEVF